MKVMVKNLWSLFKLRISFAIMLCALAGLAVTPGSAPGPLAVTLLALSVLLSAAAAGAFNHYVERDLDAQMARTRNRPFVTGYFHHGKAWLFIILALLAASVALAGLATNWAAAAYVFLGAFVYGVVYTVWLKRRSWTNIVLGGLAGSFAVLAGAAAVDPQIQPAPLILAVVLFLWTPPHFWSSASVIKADYAKAGIPMLPVVIGDQAAAWVILAHTLALALLSLLPVFYGLGLIYLLGALIGGGLFCWTSLKLVLRPGIPAAARNFQASLLQLSLLLLAAILDSWFPIAL
jgi:protoheme IX farnesyltransferase